MKLNKLVLPAKSTAPKIIIVIFALFIFGSGFCFSQSNDTKQDTKTNDSIHTRNVEPVYLDKKDPIFTSIKGSAISDLKKSANPDSAENKLRADQISTFTKDKLDQLEALFVKTINDYAAQTFFEPGTFMLTFKVLGEMDHKELTEDYDFHVLNIGGNKYVAEFWEDGIAVNSEAHALVYAHELANSEYAKKHPDSDIGNEDVIKDNYANTRKSIKDGKKERYTKVMALLYTLEKDGSIAFHNPFQPLIDFK